MYLPSRYQKLPGHHSGISAKAITNPMMKT
jgi:hypothetical protein